MQMKDYDFAIKLKNLIRTMIRGELETVRPLPVNAEVISFDRVARICDVRFIGSVTPVTVKMGALQPNAVGQWVRIEGSIGDKYITDVQGQAYIDDGARHTHTGVFQSPALAVGGDWNDHTASGFYMGSGLLNQTPFKQHSWQWTMVIRHNASYVVQVAFDFQQANAVAGSGATSMRHLHNGTWYPWALIGGDDSGWIQPAYVNSWVSYDNTFGPPGYRKKNGIVYLRGLIKGGTAQLMFTLPAGFRPSVRQLFDISSNEAHARVDVTPAGEVLHISGGSNAWVSLNSITFIADN